MPRTTPSGLQIEDLVPGTGDAATFAGSPCPNMNTEKTKRPELKSAGQ